MLAPIIFSQELYDDWAVIREALEKIREDWLDMVNSEDVTIRLAEEAPTDD